MTLTVVEKLPDMYKGLLLLGPIMVMHSYAYINPDRFYYAWNGWLNLLKLLLGLASIPALVSLFPESEAKGETLVYSIGALVVAILYILPEFWIPAFNQLARMTWEASSGVLNISKEPGYIMGDIVIPSLIVGSNMIGLGMIANQFL
jgi:hypothetical protein